MSVPDRHHQGTYAKHSRHQTGKQYVPYVCIHLKK